MARSLVTGATGFIGQQLVEALLANGDEVKCLVRSTSQKEPLNRLGAQLVNGDVTIKETLPGAVGDVETIYHLAGLTKANSLAAYCRVNEAGVRNILEACIRRTTPPRVILVSSLAAAGPMARPDEKQSCRSKKGARFPCGQRDASRCQSQPVHVSTSL